MTSWRAVELQCGDARLRLLPELGGMVDALYLPTPVGVRNVIATAQKQDLPGNPEYRGTVLFPFPNRLRDGRYEFAGQEYRFDINEPATQTALHGLLNTYAADVVEDGQSLVASYQLDGSSKAYPFRVEVSLTYRLEETEGLSVAAKVVNKDANAIPLGIGWHPYFSLGVALEECRLQLPEVSRVEIDERMLPTDEKVADARFMQPATLAAQQLDSCFELTESARNSVNFTSKQAGFGLQVWQEAMPFVQVYTPVDRQSLAIEPVSCNIDALNTGDGLTVLGSGQTFECAYGVRVIEP